MTKRLTLMRHAEAALAPGQAESDLFSLGDLPLSPRGRAQAAAARDLLAAERFDAVYASPAARARETAATVAEPHGLKVQVVDDLREFPFWTPGADYALVLARLRALPAALRAEADPVLPGGPRWSEEARRFRDALARVVDAHERPLVVAHGVANRAWLCEALGMPAHALFRLAQDHACANVVDLAPGHATLVALNLAPRGDAR